MMLENGCVGACLVTRANPRPHRNRRSRGKRTESNTAPLRRREPVRLRCILLTNGKLPDNFHDRNLYVDREPSVDRAENQFGTNLRHELRTQDLGAQVQWLPSTVASAARTRREPLPNRSGTYPPSIPGHHPHLATHSSQGDVGLVSSWNIWVPLHVQQVVVRAVPPSVIIPAFPRALAPRT